MKTLLTRSVIIALMLTACGKKSDSQPGMPTVAAVTSSSKQDPQETSEQLARKFFPLMLEYQRHYTADEFWKKQLKESRLPLGERRAKEDEIKRMQMDTEAIRLKMLDAREKLKAAEQKNPEGDEWLKALDNYDGEMIKHQVRAAMPVNKEQGSLHEAEYSKMMKMSFDEAIECGRKVTSF